MIRRLYAAPAILTAVMLTAACGGPDGIVSPVAPSATPQSASAPFPAPVPARTTYVLTGAGLSGVVTEQTPSGAVPVAGVAIYCDSCGEQGHTWMTTGADGSYRFSGDIAQGGGIWLYASRPITLAVSKEGYQDPPGMVTHPLGPGWRDVVINGETKFDMELARRN